MNVFCLIAFVSVILCICHAITWQSPNPMSNKEFTYIQIKMSWADAVNYCAKLEGRLAHIDDTVENEFAKSLTDKLDHVWLGGSDISKTWEWLNPKEHMSFRDYATGEPSRDASVNCLVYWKSAEGYKWGDNPCDKSYSFICERKKENNQDVDHDFPETGGSQSITWRSPNPMSTKEFTYSHKKMSWAEAMNYCAKLEGRLAHIDDTVENEFAKSLTDELDHVWLGGSDISKTWEWLNPKEHVSFRDFATGEPSRDASVNCLVYWKSAEGYKWGDNPCNNSYSFICERNRPCQEKRNVDILN